MAHDFHIDPHGKERHWYRCNESAHVDSLRERLRLLAGLSLAKGCSHDRPFEERHRTDRPPDWIAAIRDKMRTMDIEPAPARDNLVLKVAAGVVIGGAILLGVAKYFGFVVASGPATAAGETTQPVVLTPASPPVTVQPATSTTQKAATAFAPAAAASTSAAAKSAEPEPAGSSAVASAKSASENIDASPAPAVASASAAASDSDRSEKSDEKPRAKLEPVPEGYRCIEGRLFRVLPNGFEQVTDGSEKRYCL
jgi:hypothetical protein